MVPEQAEDRSLPWEPEPDSTSGRTDWVSSDSPRRSASARDWQVLDGYSSVQRRPSGERGTVEHGAGPAHGVDRRSSRAHADSSSEPETTPHGTPEVYSLPEQRARAVPGTSDRSRSEASQPPAETHTSMETYAAVETHSSVETYYSGDGYYGLDAPRGDDSRNRSDSPDGSGTPEASATAGANEYAGGRAPDSPGGAPVAGTVQPQPPNSTAQPQPPNGTAQPQPPNGTAQPQQPNGTAQSSAGDTRRPTAARQQFVPAHRTPEAPAHRAPEATVGPEIAAERGHPRNPADLPWSDADRGAVQAQPPARRAGDEVEIAREFDARYGAADLMPDVFPSRPKHAVPPRSGWRRGIYRLTGGTVHPSESAAERRYQAQVERIRQPIRSDYRIALLSLKGGVGKTTTTIGLGSIFASVRGDNVIAVDANPDFGTLGGRVPQQTQSTVRDLLAAGPTISRYSDVRMHSSQASSRLEVIAGERDPAASEAFTEADYRGVIDILRVHYNLILTDCGAGVMHSAMNGVLSLAHSLVLVTTPAVDGASSAAATLEWLQLHGYAHLAERTVVVVSAQRPGPLGINMEALQRHFLARCRAMVVVPFDEHLAEGGIVDIEQLRPRTRAAFVDLAAMVSDDFPQNAGRHSAAPGGDYLAGYRDLSG